MDMLDRIREKAGNQNPQDRTGAGRSRGRETPPLLLARLPAPLIRACSLLLTRRIYIDTMYIQFHREGRMQIVIKKWGNSAAVRIPAIIMETMNLGLDEAVDVRAEKGRIVIEPVRRREYDLDTL